ncbi:hypothetical protein WM40_20105 [Robbsia andropogonis]|uniref:Uncharacterized protein n=1 Tax=Robbsia andropogonis TaxID=28092 RepID=A0A0F5JVT8_9BURK|nr:hypothetical protein WM40_20105 [Robbsia andropogonis]
MPARIIDAEPWALVEPVLPLPKPRRKRYPGRLPVSDRRHAMASCSCAMQTAYRVYFANRHGIHS